MATAQAQPNAALKRRIKRKSRTLPGVIIAIVIVALSWWGWNQSHPADTGTHTMLTAKVTRGDIVETITATGTVNAQTGARVNIGSQITGTVKRLYADIGTYVHVGQPIAVLDLPDVRANLDAAKANLTAAQMKVVQDQSGVNMVRTQSRAAVDQARANLTSANAKLAAASAAARQQHEQTRTDIQKAQAALNASLAALSTAKSNLSQVQAGADLNVQTAQEAINQAKANYTNSNQNYVRNVALLKKGFVAQSVVDAAQASNDVYQSQVSAAQQALQLTKQKVTADLQSAHDAVTQAQQNVDSARAALASAQAEKFLDASKDADVHDAAAAVGQAKAALDTAIGNTANDLLKMQDIAQAQDAAKAAQEQVAYQSAQVDKTIIRTPISGTVLSLAVQQGETLAAGLSAPTLISVADLNRLEIDAYVDETDIGKVRLGQEADCVVDAFPKRVFKGTVFKIGSGSTIQQSVVTYQVSIKIEDRRHQLKPDMTANVTLQVGKRTGVLLVPSEAVKVGVKGSSVYVMTTKDGKQVPVIRKVKTGASDGVNTEIRDGLKEGDTIVRAGMENSGPKFGPQSPFGPSGGGQRPGGGGGGGRRG
jgi:RND family efflux transporter MFP subunit